MKADMDELAFRTQSRFPGHTVAVSLLNAANRLTKLWARSRMKSEGLLDLLGGRPPEAFKIESDDLWFLYTRIRARRPRLVLELGSGYSTSVLAEAVRRNGRGKVLSIDAFEGWTNVTNAALANCGLDDLAQVLHIPAVPTESHGRKAWKHASLPAEASAADFIYLDGPPLDAERPFAVDVLELEANGPLEYVVIDGRKANFNFLKRHLKHTYRFTWRHVHYSGTIERIRA